KFFRYRNRLFVDSVLIILLLIVIVSTFNYLNFSRARLNFQRKQTFLRNLYGGTRLHSIFIYTFEVFFIFTIGLLITLSLVPYILPWFNEIIKTSILLNL